MKNTLFYGGSFNPIHHGHLICCRCAMENAGFDRVVLIPAGNPWQKAADNSVADATHRMAMVRLAIQDMAEFDVDGIELDHSGATYTVTTTQQLLDRGESEVHWLIGADTATRLATWHDADRLFRLAKFVVMERPGSAVDWNQLPAGCRATPVAAPLIDISATDIRQRVAAGRSIDFLTPPAVVRYIEQHGLYRQRS